jgi:hypothetical protein
MTYKLTREFGIPKKLVKLFEITLKTHMAVKNSRAGLRQKGDTLIHNGMLCTQFFLWLFWRKEQETLKLTDRTILN